MENDCIFCKIVSGEVPSVKIWENEKFIAILDAFPNTLGMTLVIPKEHYNSDAFEMPEEEYLELLLAAKEVQKLLKKGLGVKRVAMVMEGMGVNHAHIKLYPLHGVDEFKPMIAVERVWLERYPGYLTTKMGLPISQEKLEDIANKIRNA